MFLVGLGLPALLPEKPGPIAVAGGSDTPPEAEREALLVRVDTERRTTRRRYRAALDGVRILEADAVPAIEENLRLTQRAFDLGQSDLTRVLVVQRELADTRRDQFDALLELADAGLALQRAMGCSMSRRKKVIIAATTAVIAIAAAVFAFARLGLRSEEHRGEPRRVERARRGGRGEAQSVRLSEEALEAAHLEIVRVTRGRLSRDIVLVGEIAVPPDRMAMVGPRTAARISRVNVNVGDRVERGATLATVDSSEFGARAVPSSRPLLESSRRRRPISDRNCFDRTASPRPATSRLRGQTSRPPAPISNPREALSWRSDSERPVLATPQVQPSRSEVRSRVSSSRGRPSSARTSMPPRRSSRWPTSELWVCSRLRTRPRSCRGRPGSEPHARALPGRELRAA